MNEILEDFSINKNVAVEILDKLANIFKIRIDELVGDKR